MASTAWQAKLSAAGINPTDGLRRMAAQPQACVAIAQHPKSPTPTTLPGGTPIPRQSDALLKAQLLTLLHRLDADPSIPEARRR